ncbi:unnamed protein product [Mytilus edulis]|uniref:Uncharacterized protein n=1 Tax=Mytilus edulis TaxID=6550 RepID=A0A8S3U7X7_MYTED|nr:unnamed protein product [Mytilus edulis]
MDNTWLQHIAKITNTKHGFSFIVSGNDSQILTQGIQDEMALVNLKTNNSIPNIHMHTGNHSFRYSPDDGANWFSIALSTGSYDIEDINNEIQRQLRLNKHNTKIIIDANRATLKATLTLAKLYQVDFKVVNNINTVLGFKWQIYTFGMITNGYTEGEHIVNIIRINSILVNSDINHEVM